MPVETSSAQQPASREAFNFSRAGQIVGDQVRTLRTLDEQFARNLTHTLGAWLRSSVTIAPLPSEQQSFGRFAEQTAHGCHVLPLRVALESQEVRGAMSLSLTMAPVIIDLLLGGSGRTDGSVRELTEIEEAVLGSVVEFVLREWSAAWLAFGAEFLPEPHERDSHGQKLMPVQERVYCCRFEVTLAEIAGELRFCMPAVNVASMLRAVSQRRERQRSRTPGERTRMMHRLRCAHVHATLAFPVMRLHASDLHGIRPGSLLPLPLAQGSSAELRVSGVPIFRAEPVRAGEHRAAQITQVMEAVYESGHAQ